ncbi:hypothetical protein CAMRE0001_3124 [Campylobacter rectus RM3267]|jgi:hypothetical protein|uniref:Uncharacterized protein n=2 Tax=Campylobacter rectus TaxID=203 RepID=A0A6G5QKL9_CAMRE|nr:MULTISPECIES: hypothetical protein [Campylobacter]EEF14238.1 hypothetical protein CAMRE0001_3124 [Campylobacter rectus RM3267]QCD46201.1 hypothetical protein CRECT_0511 [Campylobacter rectus]UEB46914.1 hypothetical protein LK437_07815 [Campylobacter rectus]
MISVTFTGEDTPQAIKILQDAYEALQKINPHFTMEKADVDEYEEYEPTEADKADLREILAQRERGELKYISHDEFKRHKKELFSRLGANANHI